MSPKCKAIQLLVEKGLSVTAARATHMAPVPKPAPAIIPLEIELRPVEAVPNWKEDSDATAAGPGLLQTISNFFMSRGGYKRIKQD